MKKATILFILLGIVVNYASAQATYATGTVKDDAGNPVTYAFIRNMGTTSATFSDSLGNFKLLINPNTTLEFLAKGYAGILINAANAGNVVLKRTSAAGDAAGKASSESGGQGDKLLNQNFQMGTSAIFVKPKGDTRGSQYLLDDWAHGFIIDSKDSVLQNPDYLYNYDKINGVMVFTQDKSSAMELNKSTVNSFVLFSNDGKTAAFEKAPNVDANNYVQVLAMGKKYKIYKSINTQFVKSNYQTNGLSSSGNNYDEYVDDYTYYIFNVQTNSLQKISLKKKAIKAAFVKDADKVNKFIDDHSSDDIDDNYLINLGDYMNE